MYTHHAVGLGEVAVTTAEPTFGGGFLDLLKTGISTGFSLYNKVTTMTQQQKAAATAQQQAQQMAQYAAMYGQQPLLQGQVRPGTQQYGQVYSSQSDLFSGWTIPLLLAGVAVIGVVIFKRK